MSAPKTKHPKIDLQTGGEEFVYRFPASCINLEIVPDLPGTFGVRLNWQKGKSVFAFFETTALRPIAELRLDGHRLPVAFQQHARLGMGKVLLVGERNGVRLEATIEGRDDCLTWSWQADADASLEEITAFLPFAPGETRVLSAPDGNEVLALWRNGVAVTVAASHPPQTRERALALPGGDGGPLAWELRFGSARTESEVRNQLVAHQAERADLRQSCMRPLRATELMTGALALLCEAERLDKPSMDRLHFKDPRGEKRVCGGEGTDAGRAAIALLSHYYVTGDDALRRQARLLSHGLCDFQVTEVESSHWGAFWDCLNESRKPTDRLGESTVSVITAARASKSLHVLNTHFETELMLRAALGAAQWVLLKTDITGLPIAERFCIEGPRVPGGSPWAAGESMIALTETFRAVGNETYLKAALRSINTLRTRVADGTLRPESAPTEWLAACIEGILLVSREYENQEMVAFARLLGATLRARRDPDGFVNELPDRTLATPLASTLAAARAALALARVDSDPAWLLLALRSLRAAQERTPSLESLPVADLAGLASLPLGLLLAIAARPRSGSADSDRVCVRHGWQTFEADPAVREYVDVTTLDGGPVDHLALVCPVSLQVLIAVLAPRDIAEVKIVKNQRAPYVRNLLTGSYDQRYPLEPLGDGAEARIGVFQADT